MSLMSETRPPTGSVPGAVEAAGQVMANGMGFGSGAPEPLCSSVVPPSMAPDQPQMIERYGEPYGGTPEYVNRWGGR